MENEYGITVANKYALFLNEDEDSLFLKIQDTKANKKAEKATKKNATKEKEGKPSNKQSGSSAVAQDKKAEKVDQFSSPTVNNESAPKSAGGSGQGTAPSSSDVNFESGRSRPPRDRAKPRSNASRENKDHGDDSKSSEQHRDQRPPRIRNRGGGSGGYRQDRGGFGENRQFRSETDAAVNENTDRPNSVGNYERHERRTPRNGFSEQSARPDKDRFGNETSEPVGGFGDKTERDGAGGRGYARRGFGYRGRGRPDRNQFSERSDQNRNNAGADDGQVRYEPRPQREGSNDNDGGNFMERSEHDRFTPRRDSRGRRGGYGRGRGGYDRPPRNYRRYGDRRPRQSEGDGETPNDDNKAADGELKQQQSEKLQEGAGGSWAEQIDAADQEAGNEKLNHDVEDGNEAPGDASGEPKLMTLDEWKAREDARRVKAEFNIRKPGEGYNSDPQWKKMFVLSKKEKPDDHEEEEEEDQEEEEHHTKAKNVIPIEIHFADDSVRGARGRGSGRRGGMGGPRGRGSRGGGRGTGRWESEDYRGDSRGAAQSNRGRGSYESRTYVRSGRGGAGGGRRERTPNFADEADFPSLSSPAQP